MVHSRERRTANWTVISGASKRSWALDSVVASRFCKRPRVWRREFTRKPPRYPPCLVGRRVVPHPAPRCADPPAARDDGDDDSCAPARTGSGDAGNESVPQTGANRRVAPEIVARVDVRQRTRRRARAVAAVTAAEASSFAHAPSGLTAGRVPITNGPRRSMLCGGRPGDAARRALHGSAARCPGRAVRAGRRS